VFVELSYPDIPRDPIAHNAKSLPDDGVVLESIGTFEKVVGAAARRYGGVLELSAKCSPACGRQLLIVEQLGLRTVNILKHDAALPGILQAWCLLAQPASVVWTELFNSSGADAW